MRPPRFRFTLGQLLTLVAVSAVAFAMVRTPFWPLLLAIGPVMPGFAIDRARGGPGIIGAMLGGAITFIVFGVALFAYDLLSHRSITYVGPAPYFILLVFGLIGLAYGTVVGSVAFGIMLLLGRAVRPVLEPPTESVGPIVWRGFEDRGIPHPRGGGRRP
jgi:hypothetical protein